MTWNVLDMDQEEMDQYLAYIAEVKRPELKSIEKTTAALARARRRR